MSTAHRDGACFDEAIGPFLRRGANLRITARRTG